MKRGTYLKTCGMILVFSLGIVSITAARTIYVDDDHAGRSRFGRHGYSVKSGYIYDASVGTVDVDANPDEWPFYAWHWLDGDDTWVSSYKDRVIDDNPTSSPGTPYPYNFDVQ